MLNVVILVKFFNGEISPFDESAIACALDIVDANITIMSMSPLSDKERLEYFTRYNVNCVLLSDNAFSGSDTLATAKILCSAVKKYKPDIIFCGRQSLNGDTAQVPAEIAEMLGYNFYPYVLDFSSQKVSTRLGSFDLKYPCVLSFERIKPLYSASIFSKKREIEILDNSKLNLPLNEIGLLGSPTKVINTYLKEKKSRKCMFVDFSDLEKIIKQSFELKSVDLSESIDVKDKFDVVHFVDDSVKKIAEEIAFNSVKTSDLQDIDKVIQDNKAEIILFPADLQYRAFAPRIAARYNLGLSADCIKLYKKGDRLVMVRPALSGNTIAEIVSKSKIQLATVRVNQVSNDIVFCVGYGAKDYVNEIKNLAKKYNAEVVATRKCVDNGIMPYESQVGLTGKIISPKVYVAFGVSGAVQHIVGIENSQTIIALNKNKDEKIFDYADYGIICNL